MIGIDGEHPHDRLYGGDAISASTRISRRREIRVPAGFARRGPASADTCVPQVCSGAAPDTWAVASDTVAAPLGPVEWLPALGAGRASPTAAGGSPGTVRLLPGRARAWSPLGAPRPSLGFASGLISLRADDCRPPRPGHHPYRVKRPPQFEESLARPISMTRPISKRHPKSRTLGCARASRPRDQWVVEDSNLHLGIKSRSFAGHPFSYGHLSVAHWS